MTKNKHLHSSLTEMHKVNTKYGRVFLSLWPSACFISESDERMSRGCNIWGGGSTVDVTEQIQCRPAVVFNSLGTKYFAHCCSQASWSRVFRFERETRFHPYETSGKATHKHTCSRFVLHFFALLINCNFSVPTWLRLWHSKCVFLACGLCLLFEKRYYSPVLLFFADVLIKKEKSESCIVWKKFIWVRFTGVM